jgi:hypothetical protein
MKTLTAVLATTLLMLAFAHAVKVDGQGSRNKTQPTSSQAPSPRFIPGKSTPEAGYEIQRCIAEVLVDEVEKGEKIKNGELIYVRYIGTYKWIAGGPPGLDQALTIISHAKARRGESVWCGKRMEHSMCTTSAASKWPKQNNHSGPA